MVGAGLGDACLWELGRQEAPKVQKTHDVRRVAVTDSSDDPDQLFPAYKGAGRRPVRYALLRKLNFRPSETSHIVHFLHLWASASARFRPLQNLCVVVLLLHRRLEESGPSLDWNLSQQERTNVRILCYNGVLTRGALPNAALTFPCGRLTRARNAKRFRV